MKFKKLPFYSVLIFTLVSCGTEINKPSRSDCITQVNFSWHVTGVEKVKSINEFGNHFSLTKDHGYADIFPAGAVFSGDDTKFFVQYFKENCEQKYEITKTLMTATEALYSDWSSKFSYQVSSIRVTPSFDTILLEGDDWTD